MASEAVTKASLSSSTGAQIETLRSRYPTTRALLLPALHIYRRTAAGCRSPRSSGGGLSDSLR